MLEDDVGNVEEFEFPDFEPFIAPFRKYKNDMSEVEKVAFLSGKLEEIKKCAKLKEIIYKMFDYDVDVVEIEKEIFSNAALMETVFNYMDVSTRWNGTRENLLVGEAQKMCRKTNLAGYNFHAPS